MDIQQEIRILNSSIDLITSYVNYTICCFPDDPTVLVRSVLPKSDITKKYFYILLLEVIAGVNKEMIPDKSNGDSLLDLLERVSIDPKLDSTSISIELLKKSVKNFQDWLNFEFEYEIYSQGILKNIKIRLTRKKALYFIGNRCKHSLLRSNSILTELLKIYRKSGTDINTGAEISILEDIDTWLFDDFGGYHFTKLCDLSVQIYHGIVQYIRPVYSRALVMEDEFMYSYRIPEQVTKKESKIEYYELLNHIRSSFSLPVIDTLECLEDRL